MDFPGGQVCGQRMFQEDMVQLTVYLRRYKKLGTNNSSIISQVLKLLFGLL